MTTQLMEQSVPTEEFHDSEILRQLEQQWDQGKFLCVGLDVSIGDSDEDLFEKAQIIVQATRDIAAAYKPNSAFYEREGSEGYEQLKRLTNFISILAPDVPIIWDAKRADISNTNDGYRDAAEALGMDALTVHPYLGGSAVKPLMNNPDRAAFVLAHTSNPGAAEFQHLQLKSGEQLWERVVSNVAHGDEWSHGAVKGIVTGATYPEELAKARYIAGDDVITLIPGIGTQGGDLEGSVRGAMNSKGNGFLINVSSGISKASDAKGNVTIDSVRDAALKYHNQIKDTWKDAIENPRPSYGELMITEFDQRLASALFDGQCIKFGNFTLRNQTQSPVYVNLRNAITDPVLRNNVVNIYKDMITGLEARRGERFDVLGGIPQAATSFAAIVADRMDRRLVQPRSGIPKDHGQATLVEGIFSKGESVGLIDDLIQDGGAKFDAISQIEAAGLKFGGLTMLVDREKGGFRELAARGMPSIAATTLRGLIIALGNDKRITPHQKNKVMRYLQG